MSRGGRHRIAVGIGAFLLFVPLTVWAQSSIVGLVRDESGGVLPGVTVEATSPVLIEKVRSNITDEQGRYRIVDLRPGTYRVTFVLTGFSTAVRDGVELPGNFTATINVDLKVGALEETLTVSGAAPVVDVQQVSRTQVVTREIMDTLPTTRNVLSIGILVPGVRFNRPDIGGSFQMEQPYPRVHGVNNRENSQFVDGQTIQGIETNTNPSYVDDALAAETTVSTSAVPADTSQGGLRVNVIPKDGGNITSGAVFLGGTDGKWQSKNINDKLRARNVASTNSIAHIQTFNASIGGPVLRDRIWFFMVGRHASTDEGVANVPKEIVLPDGTMYRGVLDQYIRDVALRLTWQANSKTKIAAWFQRMFKNKGTELVAGQDPRTAPSRFAKRGKYAVGSVKYTGTISPKLLVEGAYSTVHTGWGYQPQPGTAKEPFTPEWYEWAYKTDTALNQNFYPKQCAYLTGCTQMGAYQATQYNPIRFAFSGSTSYVTGTHQLKVGFQQTFGQVYSGSFRNADLVQVYVNNRPSTVTVYNTPLDVKPYVDNDLGVYVQDTWTIRRLTLNPGVRAEFFRGSLKEVSMPAGRFAPARWFPAQSDLPDWGPDWTPRFSASYDLFGDGRTALKASISKYNVFMTAGYPQRYAASAVSTDSRNWFDADLIPGTSTISGRSLPTNGDNIAQDNEIGPSSNPAFGQSADRRPADGLKRSSNWEYTAAVQHRLFAGVSVTGAWYRRTWRDIERLDRSLITLDDYTSFTLPMPSFANDPTLAGVLDPNETLTIYNLKSSKRSVFGAAQVDINSPDQSIYTGFEASFSARVGQSTVFGGFSADKNISVFCSSDDNPNGVTASDLYQGWVISSGGRFCDMRDFDIPWQQEFKLAGSHPLPFSMTFGAVLQSYPGWERTVTWSPAATLFPGGRTNAETIRLTKPGSTYLPRYNQLDINFKKNFRVANKRFSVQFDLFNALNSSAIFDTNNSIGVSLGQVNRILTARLPRVAAQFQW